MAGSSRSRSRLVLGDLGPEHVVYSPDDNGLSFVVQDIYIGHRGKAKVNWVSKLAVALNDALSSRSKDFGVDGYFFAAVSATLRVRKDLAYQAWRCGAPLYFVRCRRSVEKREAWRSASVGEKKLMSTLGWEYKFFGEDIVLPIWVAQPQALFKHFSLDLDHILDPELLEGKRFLHRMTMFPTLATLDKPQNEDISPDHPAHIRELLDKVLNCRADERQDGNNSSVHPEEIRGPLCDIFEGRVVFTSAKEFRARCSDARETGLTRMTVLSKGEITDHGLFLRSQTLKGDDQIEALIRAVKKWDRSDEEEDHVWYTHASTVGTKALLRMSFDAASSLVPTDPSNNRERRPDGQSREDLTSAQPVPVR